jgi:hypothetical protein
MLDTLKQEWTGVLNAGHPETGVLNAGHSETGVDRSA